MEKPLVDKIIERLADHPQAQVIVREFQKQWQTEIEDAFLAGHHQWCEDHRCLNPEEYLKTHYDIEV